jgi:hypothetical protein
VFESLNNGDNVALVSPAPVFVPALPPVPAGFTRQSSIIDCLDYGAAGNAEFLYAGFSVIDFAPGQPSIFRTSGVFGRSAAGLMTQRTAPAGAFILNDIEMDSTNGNVVYTIDRNQVWRSLDGGNNWTEITGNLTDNNLRSLQFIDNPFGDDVLLVGGEGGVFRTTASTLGTWSEFGMGLPNTIAYDLDYDAADDVLVAGLLGRALGHRGRRRLHLPGRPRAEQHAGDRHHPGLASEVTLADLSVLGTPDIDFFKYTAHDTGKLVQHALRRHDRQPQLARSRRNAQHHRHRDANQRPGGAGRRGRGHPRRVSARVLDRGIRHPAERHDLRPGDRELPPRCRWWSI